MGRRTTNGDVLNRLNERASVMEEAIEDAERAAVNAARDFATRPHREEEWSALLKARNAHAKAREALAAFLGEPFEGVNEDLFDG